MNSTEAKRGFLSFFVLLILIFGIGFVGKKLYDLKFSNSGIPNPKDILTVEPANEKPTKPINEIKTDLGYKKDINGDGVINSLDFPFNPPATPQ